MTCHYSSHNYSFDGSNFVVGNSDLCIETRQILPLSESFFETCSYNPMCFNFTVMILNVIVS